MIKPPGTEKPAPSSRARFAPLPPARARDTLPVWRVSIIACPVMLDLRHLAPNSPQPRIMKHADAGPTESLALRAQKLRMHENSRVFVLASFLPLTKIGHRWVRRPPRPPRRRSALQHGPAGGRVR